MSRPAGSLVDLADVWLGGPPLAGAPAAADYRIALEAGDGVSRADVAAAAESRLSVRQRCPAAGEGPAGSVEYYLRPLLIAFSPRGKVTGRRSWSEHGRGSTDHSARAGQRRSSPRSPTALGRPLTASTIVRERLLLVDGSDSRPAD